MMHPVSLGITLTCAILYILVLKGRKSALKSVCIALPMMLFAAIINPMFNHAGITVITYLPSGNPLTAESFCYGVAAASMLAAVIFYFSCYNLVMTSDKFVYLFGRIIPTLSLVFSMTLKFVPNLILRLREITNSQRMLGRDISKGSLKKRLRCAMKILSILVTWSLESAVETADSMRSRGYGIPGRTAYSIFSFDKRDLGALMWIITFAGITLAGIFSGALKYSYFPAFSIEKASPLTLLLHTAYFLLCITPVIIELREEYRWKAIK